jgi:GNAT superfamily N-acetyltransferase
LVFWPVAAARFDALWPSSTLNDDATHVTYDFKKAAFIRLRTGMADVFLYQVAAMSIVTIYLEMHSPDQLRPKRCGDGRFEIREKECDWRFNRDLYLAVGQTWSWNDKRAWTDEQWKEYGRAPGLRTFGGYYDNSLAGYYELRRDEEGGVEIAYFGLLPKFVGRGLGGALLTSAIEEAWQTSPSISRVWVHTCTLDHPSALANYQARGMVIYKQETGEG